MYRNTTNCSAIHFTLTCSFQLQINIAQIVKATPITPNIKQNEFQLNRLQNIIDLSL